MINLTDLGVLQKLGMTEREAKLYVAMLNKYETTPAELHRISGVTRTKIYETLEKMVSQGFCLERVENKHRFFRAVPPAEIKEMLIQQWEAEQTWKKNAAEMIFQKLDETTLSQQDDRSLDFIEVLRSKDQIQRKYLIECLNANTEILSFYRSPYACVDPGVLKKQIDAKLNCLKQGVESRAVMMMEEETWPWLEKHMHKSLDEGESVRVVDHLPMKMFVFDRKRIMIALTAVPGQTKADFTMLAVEDAGFTESCILLFNMFWDLASTPEGWEKTHKGKGAGSARKKIKKRVK